VHDSAGHGHRLAAKLGYGHLHLNRAGCRRGLPGVAQPDVSEGLLVVQIADDVSIIDKQRGRGVQFDAAIQAAEAVNPAHQPFAARHIVANPDGHNGLLAGFDQVGDVDLVGAAVAGVVGDICAVDPEPALGMDAADLQPDLLAGPVFRQGDLLAVPARSDIGTAQRANAAFRRDRAAVARAADTLCLPAAGDAKGDLAGQRRFGAEPLLSFTDSGRIGGEIPVAVQAQCLAKLRAHGRVDYRRRRFPFLRLYSARTEADEPRHCGDAAHGPRGSGSGSVDLSFVMVACVLPHVSDAPVDRVAGGSRLGGRLWATM